MVATFPDQRLLAGLRVVECATFVAGPSAGMTLAQLGADVIRVDPLGGASDHGRWPISARTGASLYWSALNKGKRSVSLDLAQPAGRDLVLALAGAGGEQGGVLIDNSGGRSRLSYEQFLRHRSDGIQVHIQGHSDGRPAVDYTVNPEVGIPNLTGPKGESGPVNHVLPAWDLLTGMTAATGLLAALRRRALTGDGSYIEIALADVAVAGIVSMGWLAEADERGSDRRRDGNFLYGSFGVNFSTGDDEQIMVVALTDRQWRGLVSTTGTDDVICALESSLGADFTLDEDRYRFREVIAAVLGPWFATRTLAEIGQALDKSPVLWSRYQTMSDLVTSFRDCGDPQIVQEVEQVGIGTVLSARSPLRVGAAYGEAAAAPVLGRDTRRVLTEVLGMSGRELRRLHADGIIASEEAPASSST
jgi:2-methylfumaryl-CoA isomerase